MRPSLKISRTPSWWYRRQATLAAHLLAPFASIYGRIAGTRMQRRDGYRSSLPVICVGNLTAGGAGKTPLAIHLAAILRAFGEQPAFLSRGHGGSLQGPHLVQLEFDDAATVGDEPLLLARHAPTVIARDRAAGARLIETLGLSAIVMDDGLQNPGLAKDLSLAVIDARRGIGNGKVIPAGPLRAPLALQLRFVDAIVLNAGPSDAPGANLPDLDFAGPVIPVSITAALPERLASAQPLVAFAGIGDPQKFFATLRHLGLVVVAEVPFADHHRFSERDARYLLALAQQHNAGLVTTEKDLVRMVTSGPVGELKNAATALPIGLGEPGGNHELDGLIGLALARRRAKAPAAPR